MKRKYALGLIIAPAAFGAVYFYRSHNFRNILPPTVETTPLVASTRIQEKDASTLYDNNRWVLVKSAKAEFGGSKMNMLLLKSVQTTGESGMGDPLYDVGLLIIEGNRIVYNYVLQVKRRNVDLDTDPTKFYMDDLLDIRDVTNDGVPEVVFHSGFMGVTDWVTLEHILQYRPHTKSFSDIMTKDFYDSMNHGMAWIDKAPVVIESIGRGACHMCPRRFRYNILRWNQSTFALFQTIKGRKSYEGASDALQNDLGFIRAALKREK